MALSKENVRRYTTKRAMLLQDIIAPVLHIAAKAFGMPFMLVPAFRRDSESDRKIWGYPSGCDYIRVRCLGLIAETIHERFGNKISEYAVAELGTLKGAFAGCINELFPQCDFMIYDTFEGFDPRDLRELNPREREAFKKYSDGEKIEDVKFDWTGPNYVLSRMPVKQKCFIRKGYFPESVEQSDMDREYCLVSIDADLYKPAYAGLEFFWPRLVAGGVIMLHDYNHVAWHGNKQAVLDYEKNIGYCLPKIPLPDLEGSMIIIKP